MHLAWKKAVQLHAIVYLGTVAVIQSPHVRQRDQGKLLDTLARLPELEYTWEIRRSGI